jgi:predicted nucleic acid-binding protein
MADGERRWPPRRKPCSIGIFDALIAAVTSAAAMSIATRDTGGFSGCGIALIDPWLAVSF